MQVFFRILFKETQKKTKKEVDYLISLCYHSMENEQGLRRILSRFLLILTR